MITVFFYSELHPTSMETWRLPLIPAAIGATLARNHRDIIDQELYLDPAELAHAARALKTRRVLPVHWDIWRAWVEEPHLVEPQLAGSGIEPVILAQGESVAV